jgi:Tfp pilus assembly protein PilF
MSFQTITAEPRNATYLDTYAWILFMQGRYAEARIYIDQALQNDSTLGAVVTEHAGDIYMMAGDADGAIKLWQQALAQDPGNKLLARKIKRKKYIKQ